MVNWKFAPFNQQNSLMMTTTTKATEQHLLHIFPQPVRAPGLAKQINLRTFFVLVALQPNDVENE